MQSNRTLNLRAQLAQSEKQDQREARRERIRRYRELKVAVTTQEQLVSELERDIQNLRIEQGKQAPFVVRAQDALRDFDIRIAEDPESEFRSDEEIARDATTRAELQLALDTEVAKAAEISRQLVNLFPWVWSQERDKLGRLRFQLEQMRPSSGLQSGSGMFMVR